MEFTKSRDRAIPIVKFDKKSMKPSLDDTAFAGILDSRKEIKDMPTILISIGGVARSGKSFLLNLFVNYLTYVEQRGIDEGWEYSNTPVEGVTWAQSRTAVTLGIWMWSKPFVITRHDGTKTAVLLVDSQGTGDNMRSDTNLDTLIMYISLQIASVQVLNIQKYLTSNEMISLRLCADYADFETSEQSMEGEDNFLFQSLMFVIRDYQSGEEFGEDRMLFQGILNECSNDELRKVVVGIKKAFRSINTYNMPYPGNDIATASEASRHWLISNVPESFLEITKSLIRRLLSLEPSRESQQCWGSAVELLTSFKMLKYHLENDDLPQISSPAEALQETILYKAFTVSQREFIQAVAKLSVPEQLQVFQTEQDLKKSFEREAHQANEKLKKAGRYHKYGQSRIWGKYQEMLDTAIQTAYSGIKIQYEFHKHIKRLEHQNVVVTQKMEEQADQFHQQISTLNEQVSDTKSIQAEAEDLYRAREESMKTEIEQLQRAVEDAQNDEEKERLLAMVNQYQMDTEKMRAENEKSKHEATKQMEVLNSTISEMQSSYQKACQQQTEATERLREELKEEQERRRRQEEEYKSRSKSSLDPFSLFLQPLLGALVGAVTGGPAGALLGALGSLGKSDGGKGQGGKKAIKE